ncbi:MAG: hypothetical protein IKV16_04795 [Clostridia bacterium]|nr:hypothetical protein [Clostridia bacterium]
MKKHRLIALLLALCSLFSLVACTGEYIDPSGSGPSGGNNPDGGYVPPEMNDDPTDDFTVTLLADGQPYSPRMEMFAYWSDGYSIHTAKFDSEGIARIDGLDGDYRVTLSAVPNEYTYDPNSGIATNDDRNIVLELHTLHILSGSGTNSMDGLRISETGVYSATLESSENAVYFMYSPDRNGIYTIESWVDTAADNVNPYMDVYIGTFAWNTYDRTINDGGSSGSYTMNFVHTVKLTEDQVGNNYIFAVKADSKKDQYPVTVTFAIKRDGGFEYPEGSHKIRDLAIPEHDFSDFDKQEHEYDKSEYAIVGAEYKFEGKANTYVFDERRFKIWEKNDGGDDFYHLYDPEKYAETDGYGPILYAYITERSRFIDRAFNRIEYNGDSSEPLNAALSVGDYNYKVLIEGYTHLSTLGSINDGTYFCVSECPCHSTSIETDWACIAERNADGLLIKCDDCNANCRPCPPEIVGFEGYQYYCNSDGLVPVTQELRDFLYAYCDALRNFNDGTGSWEKNPVSGRYFQAVDESGWLFDCAYYEKK